MSHGVIVFAVTNHGRATCSLRGYPKVSFRGGTVTKQPSGRLRIHHIHTLPAAVHAGAVWECPDNGPQKVRLDPGQTAYFALGTTTASSGPELDLTSLRLTLPGALAARPMPVSLYANAPSGQPPPADVTALRKTPWPWMR